MQTDAKPQNCVAAVGAMTAAMRAERALRAAGLRAQVVALSPHETRRGCAYGVEFPCEREQAARAAFRAARVSVTQYLRGGGEPL